MTDPAQSSLVYLTARLRNAITPVLIHLDALVAIEQDTAPAGESEMLERAGARLQEVEELAAVLGIACRAHAESASLKAADSLDDMLEAI
jgi:hypothetical protein